MNLPVPEWMKDEDLLKNRITELFGKKLKWLFKKIYIPLYIWLSFMIYVE
jgi:hypothetical protein